jgi:hypothetical protein
MATFKGNEGTVLSGSNAVAEIRSFSVSETADVIEDTVMGDSAKSYVASFKDATATVECYFDDTDSNGQATFDVGASVTVNFQMEGNTSGDHKLSGTALITGKDVSVAADGMVEATYSMQITGGLTEGTVS